MTRLVTRRTPEEIALLRRFRIVLLLKSLRSGNPLYADTVPAHVKATRRRRNSAARVSRRINRANA